MDLSQNGKKTNFYFSILFEPNPNSYKQLLKNKKNNEIIINSGLSNEKGTTLLNICNNQGHLRHLNLIMNF